MFKKLSRIFIPVMMALMALSSIAAPVSAGGGAPAGWCATGPRDPNPAWQVIDQPSYISDPGCGSQTRYAITMNGNAPVYNQNWNDLESARAGQNATYYNEWVGGSGNPGPSAPNPPAGWCATGPRDPNPAWSVDYNGAIPNPGCSSNTQYALVMNNQSAIHGSWANLEATRNGNPGTYYDEWVGGSTPPPTGTQAPNPPADFCKKPYGSNSPWQIPGGVTSIPNVCKGVKGAWMLQMNGVQEPIGHRHHASFAHLVQLIIANPNGGTLWFDALVKPAGFCDGSVYMHIPTGIRATGNLCPGYIVTYKLTVKFPGHAEHTYVGSLAYVMNKRACFDKNYEASLWEVSKRPKPHHPCGCR